MQLYHHTTAVNGLLIALGRGDGLEPRTVQYGAFGAGQTMGQPVVWLTKQENNIATPERVARLKKYPGNEDVKVGEPSFGGPVQCVVNVERSRHLIRWQEFMRTTKIVAACEETGNVITGRQILNAYDMPPSFCDGWWISFKPIPLSRVVIPLTPAQAIEGCEWQLKNAESHGKDFLEQWTKQRDSFAKLDPNKLLVFHNGECRACGRREAA